MSGEKVKISVSNITKRFELMKTRSEKILNLFSFLRSKKRDFWALKGVTFDVYAGEAIGIVGLNGSGKSTLLNIVSEIYPPTTGDLTINGDTSIISIGAGLKPALTGRDNIRLKLLMSGLTNKQIKQVMPTIIGFSELGDFIDQPVKSYSSGMKAKLGFSIMAHTDPDIMIIDEALSVGDSTFANKSFDKIREFKKQGKTIFFVSHSAGQVKQIADRVIWMHFGEMKEIGPATDVMSHYEKWQKEFNKKPKAEREEYIVKQKHGQRTFSAVDIARQQLNVEVPDVKPHSRVAMRQLGSVKSEQKKLVKKATKKTQKQIQNVKFGFVNWVVVALLIALIGFTSTNALADSEMKRKTAAKESLSKKNSLLKAKQKKSSSQSSKASTTSSSQVSSSSVAQDQQAPATTVVDANGNGIPDDQETVVPDTSSTTDTEQTPDTTYSDPNYVAPTTTDDADTAGVQQSAVDPNTGSATSSTTTPTTGGTQ